MAGDLVKKSPGLGLVSKKPGALGKLKAAAMKSGEYREALFLVLDHSRSMGCVDMSNYTESRMDAVKKATSGLLDASSAETSRIAVTIFDHESQIVCLITNQYQMVRDAIAAIQPCGGTTIAPALQMSAAILYLQSVTVRRMIVLSDGEAWDSGEAIQWAMVEKASYRLPIIDTIYFNSDDTGKELMMKLAEISGGKFYYASDTSQLVATFKQLDVRTRGLLTDGK